MIAIEEWKEEYSARECIEYAISCLKNKDNRKCTIRWLERALSQMPEEDLDADEEPFCDGCDSSCRKPYCDKKPGNYTEQAERFAAGKDMWRKC